MNTCELWFNGIKIAFFPKNYKISPNNWGLRLQTPKASSGRGLALRPPSVICLSYASFLKTFPKLDTSCTFQPLVYALSLCKIRVKCQQATISDLPSYNIFVPQNLCPTKTSSFENLLMTSQHVICGLGLPQSKILGTPVNWRSPEKLFEDLLFEEHLRSCPWSLASRGSVLGKAVLGLEFFFFFCVLGL